nr:Rop family plasmid primer RNA-binding protein [Klebsiella pneumoniae]
MRTYRRNGEHDEAGKTALNMAKFIGSVAAVCWKKLNELDMDTPADMCERLHEDAETLWQVMRDKLGKE